MTDRFTLDVTDLVMLFADLQAPIVRNSGTNSPKLIEAGALALVKVAGIPYADFVELGARGRWPGPHLLPWLSTPARRTASPGTPRVPS